MKPLFVSTVAVVTSSPAEDRKLFVDALGLPLTGDDDYVFTHELPGVKPLRSLASGPSSASMLRNRYLAR